MSYTNPTKPSFKVVKPKFITLAITAVLAFVIGVYFFVTKVVFPEIGLLFFVSIPGRASETTYLLNIDQYQALGATIIGVAVALLLLTLVLMMLRKHIAAAATTLVTAGAAGFYAAVMLGNGFHELWGGWWSVWGVLLAVGITLAIEFMVIRSVRVQKH